MVFIYKSLKVEQVVNLYYNLMSILNYRLVESNGKLLHRKIWIY